MYPSTLGSGMVPVMENDMTSSISNAIEVHKRTAYGDKYLYVKIM